jgi:hypothetical protein
MFHLVHGVVYSASGLSRERFTQARCRDPLRSIRVPVCLKVAGAYAGTSGQAHRLNLSSLWALQHQLSLERFLKRKQILPWLSFVCQLGGVIVDGRHI